MKKTIFLVLTITIAIIIIKQTSAIIIFNDTFESGSLAGWTLSTPTGANNWTANQTNPFQGSWHAQSQPRSTSQPASILERAIPTSNYQNISIFYYRRLVGIDAADEFQMEWFNGTAWAILESTGGASANDASYLYREFNLSIQANNNPSFQIRFECTAGATSEYCRVDNVTITGSLIQDATPPIVNLIAPINNTITTSVIHSFNATFSDNIALANATYYLWNSTNSLINTTSRTLSGLADSINLTVILPYEGKFTWNYLTADTSNNMAFNLTNFTILYDATPPSINYISPTQQSGIIKNSNFVEINITASDLYIQALTIRLFNSTKDQIQINISNTSPFYINYSNFQDGLYFYNASSNDTANNIANLETRNITIDTTPPSITSLTEFPSDPTTYLQNSIYQFNATITDLTQIQSVKLEFNGTNYTATNLLGNIYNVSISNLPAGTFNYIWFANDSAGNSNTTQMQTYTINKAAGNITLSINNTNTNQTAIFQTQTNASASTQFGTTTLLKDGVDITSQNHLFTTLGVGDYNYTAISTGDQNHSSAAITRFVHITKASSEVNLTLNETEGNITIAQGTIIPINATKITGDSSAILKLYNNETLINQGQSQLSNLTNFTILGLYNITIIYTSTQNYTESSETYYVNVVSPQDIIPPYFTTIPQNTTINYTQGFQVNFKASDNIALDSFSINWTANFEINKTGSLRNTTKLAAGTYLINVTINDTSNNKNSTIYQVIINKIQSQVNTFLNHSRSNITIQQNTAIYLNSTLINGEGTIKLYNNNSLINKGTSQLSNLTNFTILGTYNITTIHEETQNYSSSSETFYVNVTQQPDNIPPYFTTIPQNTTISYPNNFGVDFNASDNIALDSFRTNWTDTFQINRSGFLNNTKTLAAGFYLINITINDTSNNLNSTIYSVNITQNNTYEISISLSPSSIVSYPTQTISIGNNCPPELSCTLFKNNISTTNPETLTLAAGTYIYEYNTTGNSNYSAKSVSTLLTIAQNTSSEVSLFLNNTQNNITITNGTSIDINASLIIGTGQTELYKNSNLINIGNSPLYNLTFFNTVIGIFNITAIYKGNENYTSTAKTFYINVTSPPDTTPPTFSNPTTNPPNNTQYLNNVIYQFNITITDTNTQLVILQFNNINYTASNLTTNLYNVAIKNLAAGTYSYYWFANDSAGNSNTTQMQTYTINKASSNISLYLNHIKSNITIYQNTQIYLNSTLIVGEGTIKLYNNNSLINKGTSQLSNLTNFTILGTYNITTIHEETQNYTLSYETFYIEVIPIPDTTFPLVSIIQPQNTSYNNPPMQLNYSVSDTNLQSCWYTTNSGTTNTSIICGNNISITAEQGSNTWKIYANDSAGNINSSTITFFVDSITPLISFTSPTNPNSSILAQNSIFINATITETNFANITFSLHNSTSLINITTFTTQITSINFTNLLDSVYYYNVTIKDILNNQNTTETRTITIDTSAPSVQIIAPTNNATYKNSSILINISSNGQSTWFYNGTANETYSSPIYKSFPEGTNTIIAYTNNSAGTLSSSSLTFFINTLVLTCEVGGPYQQDALILVQGNLKNETSNLNAQTINISIYKNALLNISKTSITSNNGNYETTFSNLTVGNYILNTTVSYNGLNISCTDSFQIGSSASFILDKIASIHNTTNSTIYYNITLKLANNGGADSLNTNITDPDSESSPYTIGTLSPSSSYQISYLKNFTRQSSTTYYLTSIATALGINSYSNSLLTINSTQINLTIPPTQIGKQIIILKNILYISETNLNITYNISSTLYNSGDEDLININYIDTDISDIAIQLNLTKSEYKTLSNAKTIAKAASNTQYEFALGAATISSLNFYSNRPKVNIPGYGGPADVIVYAPSSLNPSISFDSIIEIKNINPDIGQDFPIAYWITNNEETQNYSSGQKTIYVGANNSANTTITLTSPSTTGTYKLKAQVTWTQGSAYASDSFEVISTSITEEETDNIGKKIKPTTPDLEKNKTIEEKEEKTPEKQKEIICNPPYIIHNLNCCLDKNNNNICDDDEKETPKPKSLPNLFNRITGFITNHPNETKIIIIYSFSIILLIIAIILIIISFILIIKKPAKKDTSRLKNVIGLKVYTSEGIEIGKVKDIFLENYKIHSIQIKLKKKKKFKLRGITISYKYVKALKDIIIVNKEILEKINKK